MLLDKIKKIEDLRKLPLSELPDLAQDIRDLIIDTISKNGGHLAPSLGVVDITIALHYVFNTPDDKIIWDVGHQTYAHKILTGRKDEFHTIRKFGGLSGFPKRKESNFDTFDVGHSSTSLSLAHGTAVARDLNKKKSRVIAVIGDASITNGMAFEALNQIGHMKNDLIIILNDNDHSICKNVGALSKYLNRIISGSFYNRMRRRSMEFVKSIPGIGNPSHDFIARFFDGFKSLIVPGQLFEDMGIRYFGPLDGHNFDSIIELFENVKNINWGPKMIHVLTRKGKGYIPAENNPTLFHGIGPFDKKTGAPLNKNKSLSYSEIAGKTLLAIADKDKKIVTLTAAMKIGTGLQEFEKKYPRRFYDVGIAEQHMLTFAASLAASGLKPFVSIYSTFLQRAFDQLVHDIALMNLPVKILIDRAGIVGDDGETHHGLYDIALIRNIPNFILLAPSNGDELKKMILYAADYNDGPVAIRYPKGKTLLGDDKAEKISAWRSKKLTSGKDLAVFAVGDMVDTSLALNDLLKERGISSTIVNLLSLKPLDIRSIQETIRDTKAFITLENAVISGGVGEYILRNIDRGLSKRLLFNGGFPDEFVSHGSMTALFKKYRLDPNSLFKRILKIMQV